MTIIEPCHSYYRNLCYLVEKSSLGKYRLVNISMKLNQVTIRFANWIPSRDEFSEEFAGYVIFSIIDFFSSYNLVELGKKSEDLTAFMTLESLLQMINLSQRVTHFVAQFV